MTTSTSLKVTSHVGRDLLQSAASFKTDYAVVWEYVVNSLQYVDDGVVPKVQVTIPPRAKEIKVADNGRGMTAADLERFFKMHAENSDRARGRQGRGKFGTGKSAAFGIGTSLSVDTVRLGLRNVVKLTRGMIDASNGDGVPVAWVTRDEQTQDANGTTITIGGVMLPKINVPGIIEYVERHLQAFRARQPDVGINNHICEYKEPQVSETFTFNPSSEQARILGDATLTIKVSPGPLLATDVGIVVTAGAGNFVAVETGGIERKEMGNYLFGEIDVPALETYDTPLAPYDGTRSLVLNPHHPVCANLIPFIGSKLEEVRQMLGKRLSEQRKSEQARRLAAEADKIAEVLNKDFRNVVSKLDGLKAVTSHAGSATARFGSAGDSGNDASSWVEGTTRPGNVEKADDRAPNGEGAPQGRQAPPIRKSGSEDDAGGESVDPAGGEGKRRRPQGGFRVEYRELGPREDRSRYDRTTLTILINLDHPAARNAIGSAGIEDPQFRRLSYEIAFTEYSIALGYELAERDPDIAADDLLYEVRSTLNRVAASAAALYA